MTYEHSPAVEGTENSLGSRALAALQYIAANLDPNYAEQATDIYEAAILRAMEAIANGVPLPGIAAGKISETITLTGAVAGVSLSQQIPAGGVVIASRLTLDTTITATTATKVGLGRAETTAAPAKYNLSADLTAATTGGYKVTGVLADASAAETPRVFACNNAGAAAGTINAGTITAELVYVVML